MANSTRSDSVRTCIGCRERDRRDALLRFVLADDSRQPVPDLGRRLAGRGASLHPRRGCIAAAVKRGAFRRAFRREATVAVEELVRLAWEQYSRRMEELTEIARRSRGAAAVVDGAIAQELTRAAECMAALAEDA